MKSNAGRLDSRQTSIETTISSSSIPQSHDVDCKVSRAAEPSEANALVTKIACVKRVRRPLKRKTRNMWEQSPSKFSILSLLFVRLIIL
jgi:hypothetical protein